MEIRQILKLSKHSNFLHQELCKSSIDICIRIFPDNIHKMGKFKRMLVLFATDDFSLNIWFGRKKHAGYYVWKR